MRSLVPASFAIARRFLATLAGVLVALAPAARADMASASITIGGVPCKRAIADAWADRVAKNEECQAILRANIRSGGNWDHARYSNCSRDLDRLMDRYRGIQRECRTLESQYRAWKSATTSSVETGVREGIRQRSEVTNTTFAKNYVRFEKAAATASVVNDLMTVLQLPTDASLTEKYRAISDLVGSSGALAVPGLIPNFMTSLALSGISTIQADALQRFEEALQAANDLQMVDGIKSRSFVPARLPYRSPQIPPYVYWAMDLQQLDQGGGDATVWVANLQRAVAEAQAIAQNAQRAREAEQRARERAAAAQAAEDEADRARRARRQAEADDDDDRSSRSSSPTLFIPIPRIPAPRAPTYSPPPSVSAPPTRAPSTGSRPDIAKGR